MASLIEPGSLLISMPSMLDPNFMHTVILLVDHTPMGAYGLVVNRQLGADLGGLMPDRVSSSFPVHCGGPVEAQTLQFVHRLPQLITGGTRLGPDLYLGGSIEAMLLVVEEEGVGEDLRVLLGSSGWGAGQLENELQTGSWRQAPPDADSVFKAGSAESIWRAILGGLDAEGEQLSHLPPDVRWN
ncbi:MAG TPA: YqgE/AlgH family protein [Planctomycetes bacterium]|nr:YqgE/AlgH family protein [Planctomycetota bacterium]HIK61534.1 YqgE/AlgH family protein [Planctomycetota bacterium]